VPEPPKRRQLSLFDVLCLGVNAIVGSGIYAFPGLLAEQLGPISFLAFGLCGLLSTVIALCFAEAAGMFERSGGPYLYAQAALGRHLGYLVGWTCWVAAVMSWAAVACAIAPYLGHLWAPLGSGTGSVVSAVGITVALGVINYLGVKPGAYTMDLLTVAKLLPLLVLVAAGFVAGEVPQGSLAPHGFGPLPTAAFTAFFAFQGFEVVAVPAGETARPQRNIPIAVLGSLLGATLLYMLVQWTATMTTPALAGAEQPLAEMGRVVLGDLGGRMVASAAAVSMLGFCAGVALTGPRYLEPLAADGHVPASLSRLHARLGTPHHAIIVTTGVVAVLIVLLNFGQLVNLAVLTVSAQYLTTCLSVLILRYRDPARQRPFRLPLGPVIPILAMGIVTWLTAQAKSTELLWFVVVLAVGFGVRVLTRLSTRWR
jgi:basic amino acid/polyamine antiporter, APA family